MEKIINKIFRRVWCVVCTVCNSHATFIILAIFLWPFWFCSTPFKNLSSTDVAFSKIEIKADDAAGVSLLQNQVEDMVKSYEHRVESAENRLILWASVMTIVFLVFSILGLLEIDKRVKKAEKSADEIDSKNKTIFSTVAAVMFAEKTSNNLSKFIASAYGFMAGEEEGKDESSRSDALRLFLRGEEAHAWMKEDSYECALDIYNEAIQDDCFESQSKLLKSLLYYHRAICNKMLGRKKGAGWKEKFRAAIEDFKKAASLAWDNRVHAFFCVMAGDTWLDFARARSFDPQKYKEAEAWFEKAKKLFPQTRCFNRMLGLYWAAKWDNRKSGDIEACKTAIKFFRKVESEINELTNSGTKPLSRELAKELKRARRNLDRLYKQKKAFFSQSQQSNTVGN